MDRKGSVAMKRPNPIFVGVITLAALLPHAPKLLPGSTDDFVRELTPPSVQTAPFDTQIEHRPEMPTAELPSISAETSDCAGSGLDENQDRHPDSEPAEKRLDSPAM